MKKDNEDYGKKFLTLGLIFLFVVGVGVAWKLGLFNAIAKPLVEKTLQDGIEGAKESQQPEGHFEVIFKDGTRVKAKRVTDSKTG